jgi:hypothetical protein
VYLFYPEYLSFIVPSAELTYQAYDASFRSVLMKQSTAAMLIGTILYVLGRQAPSVDRRGDVFIVAMAGFFASYLVQHKGWSYHLYPALAMMWLGLASLVLLRRTVVQSRAQLATSVLIAAWAGQFILIPVLSGPYRNGLADQMLPIVDRYARHGAIYAFTSETWVGFPLVNEAHVQWASRFPEQWFLPGVLKQLSEGARLDPGRRARLEQLRSYQTEAVVEDLERWTPDLVIVAERDRIEFLGYYLANAKFADMWKGYVRIGVVQDDSRGGLRPFGIWCRTGRSIPCNPLYRPSRHNDDRGAPRPGEPPG